MLFPNDVEIEYNHTSKILEYPQTNCKMQLDIWIPKYNISFEYQGEQHYLPHTRFGQGIDIQVSLCSNK
jgi:hypothetical protein